MFNHGTNCSGSSLGSKSSRILGQALELLVAFQGWEGTSSRGGQGSRAHPGIEPSFGLSPSLLSCCLSTAMEASEEHGSCSPPGALVSPWGTCLQVHVYKQAWCCGWSALAVAAGGAGTPSVSLRCEICQGCNVSLRSCSH